MVCCHKHEHDEHRECGCMKIYKCMDDGLDCLDERIIYRLRNLWGENEEHECNRNNDKDIKGCGCQLRNK